MSTVAASHLTHTELRIGAPGYSRWQFDPLEFRDHVRRVAKVLPRVLQWAGTDVVAVCGKSGMSLAFGLQMLMPLNLLVVRKKETTHGDQVEGNRAAVARYIILDDFVSSGATVARMHDTLCAHAIMRDMSPPQLVAVIGASEDASPPVLKRTLGANVTEYHYLPITALGGGALNYRA